MKNQEERRERMEGKNQSKTGIRGRKKEESSYREGEIVRKIKVKKGKLRMEGEQVRRKEGSRRIIE